MVTQTWSIAMRNKVFCGPELAEILNHITIFLKIFLVIIVFFNNGYTNLDICNAYLMLLRRRPETELSMVFSPSVQNPAKNFRIRSRKSMDIYGVKYHTKAHSVWSSNWIIDSYKTRTNYGIFNVKFTGAKKFEQNITDKDIKTLSMKTFKPNLYRKVHLKLLNYLISCNIYLLIVFSGFIAFPFVNLFRYFSTLILL